MLGWNVSEIAENLNYHTVSKKLWLFSHLLWVAHLFYMMECIDNISYSTRTFFYLWSQVYTCHWQHLKENEKKFKIKTNWVLHLLDNISMISIGKQMCNQFRFDWTSLHHGLVKYIQFSKDHKSQKTKTRCRWLESLVNKGEHCISFVVMLFRNNVNLFWHVQYNKMLQTSILCFTKDLE